MVSALYEAAAANMETSAQQTSDTPSQLEPLEEVSEGTSSQAEFWEPQDEIHGEADVSVQESIVEEESVMGKF